MKPNKYMYLISISFLFVSCASKTEDIAYRSSGTLINTVDSFKLKEQNDILLSQIDTLQKQIQFLEQENKTLKQSVLISGEFKEESGKSKDKVEAVKINITDKPISIDGSSIVANQYDYYLAYDNQFFISSDFIKSYFNREDEYGIIVKGFPIESYLIKTSGILNLVDFVENLQQIYKEESTSGNYEDIEREIDGLKLIYGEKGLIKYIVTNSLYMTQRGITVGSTKAEVTKAYGQLGKSSDSIWHTFLSNAEYSEGNSFTFIFDTNDTVSEIHYGWK